MNGTEYHVSVEEKGATLSAVLLEWTAEPPTQEGWYWASPGIHRVDCEIVWVIRQSNGELVISGDEWNEPLDVIKHWLGPLPVPEPPSG